MQKTFLILLFLAGAAASAQGASTLESYVRVGHMSIDGVYGSADFLYTHRLSPRFTLTGGMELSTAHTAAFGGLLVDATVSFPMGKSELLLSNRLLYHQYGAYAANELNYRLALTWNHPHLVLTAGAFCTGYFTHGAALFELLNVAFEARGRLKPEGHPWNLSLSIRNFDDFVYEYTNWRAGIRGDYRLNRSWRLFGEVVYNPAGVFNFASTYYEMYGKLGFIFQW